MSIHKDDTVLMPIKTKRSVKEAASKLFGSRGLTMTAGVNLLLTEMISRKNIIISFDGEGIEELSAKEKKQAKKLKNLGSFLDSIPG